MTASLALLPQRQPASSPTVSLPQRPKLHINTQQLRTFGKGSSLRLDTLSAISPTVRNTFTNAYDAQTNNNTISNSNSTTTTTTTVPQLQVPASGRPSKPRLSIDSSFTTKPTTSNSNPPSSTTPNSASTFSSTLTSASSNDSATIAIPYKQPHNLASILSNGPTRQIIPRKMNSARPLFPAEKRVSFRTPLEEEIKTVKFTLAHSDIESTGSTSTLSSVEAKAPPSSGSSSSSISLSLSTPSSTSDASSPLVSSSPVESSSTSNFASLESSPRPKGPRTGEKRDSSDSDSDSCPETPVAGRRKRRRDWHWTLGPLPTSSEKSTSSTTSDATASDDSS